MLAIHAVDTMEWNDTEEHLDICQNDDQLLG